MKQRFYRVTAIALALILLIVLAVGVSAANKTTGIKDGLYVVLTTDDDKYTASDLVSVKLQIINNSKYRAHIQTKIQFPAGLKVSAGTVTETGIIEVGSIFNSGKLVLAYDAEAANQGQNQSQPQASQPQASQPQASQPQASQPQASQPQASQPQASQPQASQPQASQPQASQPQASQPQESQPQESQPQESQPQESQPQESQPQESQPQESQPQEPQIQEPQDDERDMGWIVWVIVGVILVAGVVCLLVFGKKWKSSVSLVLCIAMMLSFVTMATPARAEDAQKSFDVSTKIVVDGNEMEIKAVITYTMEELQQEEEEEDDGRLVAFYYNDFEDPNRAVQDGATLEFGDGQVIDSAAEADGKNHYGYIEIKNKTSSAYLQADLKNTRPVEHMVMRMDLSTGSFVPFYSYFEYRYSAAKNTFLLTVGKEGVLTIGSQTFNDVKIEKGKWLQLEFVFDFTDPQKDTAEVFVNNEKLADIDYPKSEENYGLPYLRFTANGGAADAVGGSIWLDNIAIYESDKRLPMDQVKSPKIPVGERRTTAPDVEMDHPELLDMGKDAIVVLANSKNAYAGEKVVQLSANAQAVIENGEIVDVKVPGSFLNQYLGTTGLNAGQMYSLMAHANGKNVVVDSRGLMVVSEKKLDAEKDIKLLTMVYGYLKTGVLAENYAVAPIFTQAVIDDAFATYDVGFNARSGQSDPAMKNMNAIYYMLLAARMDETVAASDGRLCKDEAIRRIKNLISGGKEPGATVGCFWAQSIVGNILLLAKNTPSIWQAFTAAEHSKMDLLMECLAIASNWGYNAGNDYRTGFDMHGNYGKNYSPNYMSAGFVNYLTACMYFGAEKVDEIFVNFDHADYLRRLEDAGFTNIIVQWTFTDLFGTSIGEYMTYGGELLFKSKIEWSNVLQGQSAGSGVGVKVPWQYKDLQSGVIYDRDDFMLMVFDYLEYCYGLAVISSNGIPGSMTYAYIMSGKKSPYAGQMGMMTEFSSQDGGSFTRSRCAYTYLSAQVVMGLYANMKLLGFWEYDEQTPEVAKKMREMDSRIRVGTLDLLFKINEGYMGSAQRKLYEEYPDEFARNLGLNFVQDLWHNFHDMNVKDGYTTPKEFDYRLESPAQPMNGITKPPVGALIPTDIDHMGKFHPEMEYLIDGNCYSTGSLEFDLVFGDKVRNTFEGNIIIGDSLPFCASYTDHSMLIQLNDGNIMVFNEDSYDATGLRYGANYRFHFQVDFDAPQRKYDVTITQIWPRTDKPVTATLKGLWFRTTGSASYVDTVLLSNGNANDPYWLESVEITGTTRPKTDNPYYKNLTVKMDWGDVPENERPSSVKVNLVYKGIMLKNKYVTFTAADGWADKVLDMLPVEINDRVPEYSVYQAPVGGYLAIPSEIKDDVITITQTTQPIIFESDFEDGELGKLVDAGESYGDGKAQFVTEGNNKYLALNDVTNKSHQLALSVIGMFEDGVLSEYYSTIFFEMDIKKASTDSNVSGYAVGYRRPKPDGTPGTDSHNLVSLVSNKVMAVDAENYHQIGMLTDEWQRLKVCLDIAGRRALISYGSSSNYIILENLPEVVSSTFYIQTWANQNGLALDNLKVYCDTSKSFDEIIGERPESVNVAITWQDIDNAENRRPTSVSVKLYADGEPVDTLVVTEQTRWEGVFENLPKKSPEGEPIVYTVSAEVEGYAASYDGANITLRIMELNSTFDKNVHIVWDDNNNEYGKRPQQVTVQLLLDGEVVEGKTLVLTAENAWSGAFENLVKYNSQTLEAYNYSVSVSLVPGYIAVYEDDAITLEGGDIKATVVEGQESIPD